MDDDSELNDGLYSNLLQHNSYKSAKTKRQCGRVALRQVRSKLDRHDKLSYFCPNGQYNKQQKW